MAGKTVISDDEDEVEVYEEERDNEPNRDRLDGRDDDDEEDEEDEEGQDEYEKDGFIVDDVEEEGEEEEEDRADSGEEKQKKKKRKKRESEYVLDEDDYELLQESNISVPRPKLESKNGKGGRSAEEKLKRSLFGDDEEQPLEDIAEDEQLEEEDADIGEEDEMADFIVDEEEVDEHGAPVRRKKPKKIRKTPGISSSALQEAHDIFGDADEILTRRQRSLAMRGRQEESGGGRLEDEFEPVILSEKYMTEKDDLIREIDIPERMQVSEESTGPPSTDELSIAEERDWIYSQLVSGAVPLFNKRGTTTEELNELSVIKDDIARFLELMHVQKLDVPFIAMYRKEEILSLLKDPDQPSDIESLDDPNQKPRLRWHKVLWTILDLDKKWLLLQKRKSALETYYNKRFDEESRRVYDETRLNLNRQLFDSITKSLKAADSEREVDDVDSKFNLHFPAGEAGADEGQFKRPKRKSQYSICSKAGLWEVASKFGYSSEQFGLQISLEKMRMDELEDAKETPEEMASSFTCAMFETPQTVLRGARHMAAVEISCEPCVRKHVRSIFMDNAVVSTSPTPDGNVAIDSFHQFAEVKWLRDKPLSRFEDAQWLLIQKAEEEKLLKVTIKLPEPILDKLISDSNDYYLSDGVSKSAQLWNEQRKLILKDAFSNFLLPSMEKEARSLLTSRAKNWLLWDYGKLLWDKVSLSPYQRKENDANSDEEAAPRVMACCWGPGKPATTFVMLDSSGEVLDVLYAGSLSLRGQNFTEMAGKTVISDDEDEVEVYEEERDNEPDGERVHGRDDDDEEDEEEEEGQDEYEKDGFIVDDVEDEEEEEEEDRADSGEERQKKKKRKKRESEYMLDEDDYELLQESNISVPRPKLESKKFKRLKKARRDTEEDTSGFSDEEELVGSGKGGHSAEEKLKRSLFGDDDGQPLEDIAEEDEQLEEEDADIGEEDEMADFIVDEEEVDEHGVPVRRKKPKKTRKTPGISSSALQEAHDIFGDVDDLLKLRKRSLAMRGRHEESGEWKERRLEDEFEPVILSEKYMTEKDDRIREIDIPERMQISEESTGPPPTDELSIAEERDWIYGQLIYGAVPLFNKRGTTTEELNELSVIKDDIARFLELMHVQKLDVPFIAMYRKEEILSLLKDPDQPETDMESLNDPNQKPRLRWHKVLWTILDLDKKWLLLQKRKSALETYYNKRFEEESRRVYDETRLNLNRQLFESITKSLKAADSEREVDDVDSKFNLHFPAGESGADEGQFKRPKRKSQYSICSKAGLWEVANKFGYSSEQFGLQISLEKMRMDELEDAKETPEEMASNFTCAMFETPQVVLRGARHMAAVEISCEPCVRKHIRSIFMENAVVSTSPTPDGNVAIDSFHQFAGVKWLRDKPLTRFEDAQWLLIQKAEQEKLLKVTINLPEPILDKLISDSNDYYLSDGVSKSAQLWNEQRKLILQDAFSNFLLPSMEKEARSLLTSRAKNWLLWDYGKLLWDKVSVSPYQRKENDANSDEEAAPRVMACCWGPGKPAITFVMLDSSGEVLDVLYAGSLSEAPVLQLHQQRKKNDQQRVQKFMMDHQPHVVVLGAVNLSCTRLKEDIYEIIFKMVEDNPRDVGHEMDNLNIVYGDESLPHLYENSRISTDQLPGQAGIVRRAVALGRTLQNPLAMFATLCGPGREILSWKLNPLESFLTPDEKYGMVEEVMVDVTNRVGLDINLAASHEWLFAPLQFIAGLGPRKAASLQRSLVRAGAIFTRKDLLTAHGLGKKVFVNAVGFLRVRRSGLTSSSSQFIDLLDDTRIHPESYGLAQELAKDIYREDGNDDANDDEDVLEMAIEHVREKPNLLRSVDIHEYAEHKNRLNKKETLNDIRLELMEGFQDWRIPYVEPTQDDEFCMISGEKEETLSEGRIVQATVRRVQAQKATCVLESGLTGLLNKEDYTDDWKDINELTDKLREGDILSCT
ncbi:unnamed protein product [Fraxinus pennsylvanica]|uniref:S1 motif domain-containing protein n=1 Tax=Fraxinus pennsylvanica TaxID=56036 RepID=A0AAD2A0X1_9LAMI|nr:unnamed protein product [Fraxinus pennsylvanica]